MALWFVSYTTSSIIVIVYDVSIVIVYDVTLLLSMTRINFKDVRENLTAQIYG